MRQLEKKVLPRGRRKRGDGIKQSLRAQALVISGQQLTACLSHASNLTRYADLAGTGNSQNQ
jgi:hypothetical protein